VKVIRWAVVILLIGCAVRLAVHDYFGLDGDDMISILVSHNDPIPLINGLLAMRLDIHPPLHYLLLKGWITAAGDGLLALRAMNMLTDLLTGAILIRLTARVYSRRAGLLAGLLWTFAPALIWADYLVRMYALLALCVTGSVWCLIEAILAKSQAASKSNNGGGIAKDLLWPVASAAFALAGVYTHLIGTIALIGLLLTAVAIGIFRIINWRKAAIILTCYGLTGILALPYLVPLWNYYRSQSKLGAQYSTYAFKGLIEIPGTILSVLVAHHLIVDQVVILLMVPTFGIGSWLLWRRYRTRISPLLIVLWISLAAMTALAYGLHIYQTFYLAPFVPMLLVVLVGLVLLIPRPGLRVVAMLVLVALSVEGTFHDLNHAARDDPFPAAQFVEQHERPGDLVLVAPDWAAELFKYHYHGSAPVVGVFQGVTPEIDLDSILPNVTKGYQGVWLLGYEQPAVDPDMLLDNWFNTHAILGTKVYPTNIAVAYYDLSPQKATLPSYAQSLDARFGVVAALRGVYLPIQTGSATDQRLHPPSNWVQVVLYWESLKAGADFKPRVRFTDDLGQVYGAEQTVGPDAMLPKRVPITSWMPGQLWEVMYDLNLNPQTPPGIYNIEVTVLDSSTADPLPATGADAGAAWVIAGHFTIQ
jgi:Dolichyl-phosphate-mannose-protein mannosyltransferase